MLYLPPQLPEPRLGTRVPHLPTFAYGPMRTSPLRLACFPKKLYLHWYLPVEHLGGELSGSSHIGAIVGASGESLRS